MADYTKATGSTGTMMIRDTGSWVEFWLKAGSQTFNYQLPWAYTANGSRVPVSGWNSFRFESGGAWQMVGSVHVTTNQTVTFHLGSTGTAGLGGPTDFSVAINRATVPPRQRMDSAVAKSPTSIEVSFSSMGDGGSPITSWELAYGTDPNAGQHHPRIPGSPYTVTGLYANTRYYFWIKAHNAVGGSVWDGPVSTVTLPPKPIIDKVTILSDTEAKIGFAADGISVPTNVTWEVGYGTSSSAAQNWVRVYSNPATISGLTPGRTYYFWVRFTNVSGSSTSTSKTGTTWTTPAAPDSVTFSEIKQSSVRASFVPSDVSYGTGVLEWQIGYGTNPDIPITYVSGTDVYLSGLGPGLTYYFWARARNSVGWGSWSARSQVTLVAGALVLVGNVWRRAVPYVRVNGVWRLAEPYARSGGVWREAKS